MVGTFSRLRAGHGVSVLSDPKTENLKPQTANRGLRGSGYCASACMAVFPLAEGPSQVPP